MGGGAGRLLGKAFDSRKLLDVPRSSAWLKKQLYPPAFLRYVTESRDDPTVEQEWLLLGDRNFIDLLTALDDLPRFLDPNWVANEPLHQRRHVVHSHPADSHASYCERVTRRKESASEHVSRDDRRCHGQRGRRFRGVGHELAPGDLLRV